MHQKFTKKTAVSFFVLVDKTEGENWSSKKILLCKVICRDK